MTNDELNRKVAELRGWAVDEHGTPPDYCDNPAMWGRLFIELVAEGNYVHLVYENRTRRYEGWVERPKPHFTTPPVFSDSPGRALCLAYVTTMEGPL